MKKKQMFYNMRKEKKQKISDDAALKKELAEIEKAAQTAYVRDQRTGVVRELHTRVGADGKKQTFSEYRPPEQEHDPDATGGEAAKNFIQFYNQRFRNTSKEEAVAVKSYDIGTNGWGKYSEDKKFYRAEIIKIAPRDKKEHEDEDTVLDPNKYLVRYTDYGNEEWLERENFTTEEPALWMKPPEHVYQPEVPPEGAAPAEQPATEPGQWATVESGQGIWSSNEVAFKEREKMTKQQKKAEYLSRGDKYSGGSNILGYGDFHQDIDADDYGLDAEEKKDESVPVKVEFKVKQEPASVKFKKRKRKRRPQNIRSK